MRFYSILLFFLISCSHLNSKKGLIIAHRGASAFLPEHTLEAYSYAHAKEVDFIETDIVFTKDSKAICLHDIYLEPTTNIEDIFPKRKRKDGHWYAIDFTLKEIKKLRVHERTHKNEQVFPKRFPLHYSSFQIPTFEEFIELVEGLNKSTGKDIGIYPEIKKPEFHEREGINSKELTINIIKKYNFDKTTSRIFIQSFDPKSLKWVQSKNKYFQLIQLIGENDWGDSSADFNFLKTNQGLDEIATYAAGIGIWFNHIKNDPTIIHRAKNRKLKVHVYTYRPESMSRKIKDYFKRYQIDGIFTDIPSNGDIN